MINVGVIKLGARISFNANDTSGGNGEARSIIKMLHQGGASVTIFTKLLRKDTFVPDYTWIATNSDLSNYPFNNLDALVIINGRVNFFGGAEDVEQLRNYEIINRFHGPVFYAFCDPELTLRQVWPSVAKKPWANKWSQSQLEITRNDIIYITQPRDTQKILSDLGKDDVIPKVARHFPFEQFPCLNPRLPVNLSPSVDLSYGGTMRGNRRIKKMVQYYFGHPDDIRVEMFGKIEADDFDAKYVNGARLPEFSGPVKYDEMLTKMNKSLAHCAIGDPYYAEVRDLPQRIYESINSNVVTFIDTELDVDKRVYGTDAELSDFLYVRNREDLSYKIKLLKDDPELRAIILAYQHKAVGFNDEAYCRNFVDLLIREMSHDRSNP